MQSFPSFPRRTFLKTASAAIATSQFPILGANDRIALGVVGLGGRGTDHLRYYSTFDADARIGRLPEMRVCGKRACFGGPVLFASGASALVKFQLLPDLARSNWGSAADGATH